MCVLNESLPPSSPTVAALVFAAAAAAAPPGVEPLRDRGVGRSPTGETNSRARQKENKGRKPVNDKRSSNVTLCVEEKYD